MTWCINVNAPCGGCNGLLCEGDSGNARDNRSHILRIANDLVNRSEQGECVGLDDLDWARRFLANNRVVAA